MGNAYLDYGDNGTKLNTANGLLDDIKTDVAALEVLVTAGNADIAAIKTDIAALEVLLTATNGLLDDIKTNTAGA
jgi:hypothetical protein